MAYGAEEAANVIRALVKGAGGCVLFVVCLLVCWLLLASELRVVGNVDPTTEYTDGQE
jgi:hypothetical protein